VIEVKAPLLPLFHINEFRHEPEFIYLPYCDQWRRSRKIWDAVDSEDVPEWAKQREKDRILKYS